MATVSKEFRDAFERWAAGRLASGYWSEEEMAGLREMIRKDLQPGPDQLRGGLTVFNDAGIEVPATIDDHEERRKLWHDFFLESA